MKYRIVNRFRFITFVVTVVLIGAMLIGTVANVTTALDNKENEYISIVVSTGDSLWKIAKEYGNQNKDIREVIYDICMLNNVSAGTIYDGQELRIPIE